MDGELKYEADIKKALSSKEPTVIFFYMIGCPHCEKMKTPWENLKEKHSDTKLVKVESQNVPDSLKGKINGFPHFMRIEGGKEKVSVGGSMTEAELEGKLFGGLRGGRSRRLRRRTRKVKRTLRRHI
jgi:thiol-disulfide isomerase/thioredoxin